MSTRPTQPPPAAPPPPDSSKKSPRATIPSVVQLDISSGVVGGGQRIGIYGPGGVGKSTLAAYLPGPLFLDLERGTREISVARDSSIPDWPTLRGKLATIAKAPPAGLQTVVLDTATQAEELGKEFVIANRRTEKGDPVDSIEGFGWGKGWQFVYEEFCGLLADLDRLVERGLNVCLIMHEASSPVPNPSGEDYIRWEPHLYAGDKNRRGSIRDRVKQWCDHLLFIGYDVWAKDGKARGTGSRTIYTYELPTHIAKTRRTQTSIAFTLADPAEVWRALSIVPEPTKNA